MGKRKSGAKLRALGSNLTKKQKKHLRDFGEEHPFHDEVLGKAEPAQIVELTDSSEQSDTESDVESGIEQVTAYQHLCSTLKNVGEDEDSVSDNGSESEFEEVEEDQDKDDEEKDGSEVDDENDQEEKADVFSKEEKESSTAGKELSKEEMVQDDIENANDLEADFTDVKDEAKFCLENNFIGDGSEDESDDSSEDPFKQHMNTELEDDDVKTVTEVKSTMQSKWNTLGQLVWSSHLPKYTLTKELSVECVKNLHLHKPLETTWPKINGQLLSIEDQLNQQEFFTPLQQGLFNIINGYKDLYYPERTAIRNGEEVRRAYCLHVINHVLKANSQVLNNNAKCRDQKAEVDDDLRDQGLTRPKVLIVVPFRESALRVVQTLIGLLDVKDKLEVSNKKRFKDEYGSRPEDRPPNLKRPEDYEAIFAGNIDDHFRIGVAILRRSMRLYAPFYSSDIIIASPLGLRTIIKTEGDKTRDFDFLSSIEVLIIDQADLYLMQNWEHIVHLLNHLNQQPHEPHGVDFSRVRMWSLNNWSKYYRQTLIFSALQDPQINAIYSKHCFNYRGQVAVSNVPRTGSICHVVVQLPHVFQRLDVANFTGLPDARFEFFIKKILPQYREAVMSHTLIYVPIYFDYVRLRNYFNHEEMNFSHICEYSKKSTINRARYNFLKGEKPFLLFTERFHFYKRYTIKGIRHLIFYELPTYPHFYSDICNMLKAENRGDEATWTCTVLYSKYDAQKLSRVVGAERAAQMIQSKKSVHLFITGEES
ncbi:digestive organ expansion factor [Scyliorhinus canicula]|uniref:digestive organ expansion factor n=1 Tax=Scyliorhinus canicula TaxID=7830 RepID=UPI0018F77BD2|nr:digestive organ expansion factor [Scyliorhinus canicula]XP_038668256.1 digestive organ expansion factor [Scyliorhinus canicula]XP_038668265.1 digestive organ expansion factor [Scyliorhinus canicula]